MNKKFDPVEAMADMRHEFGEHGGVNMSVETSTTYTVMHADTMPEIFQGRRLPGVGGPRSTFWESRSPPWKEPRTAIARPAV
jgi:hypothetical protein